MRVRRSTVVAAALLGLAIWPAGCSRHARGPTAPKDLAPSRPTPQSAVQLLQSAYERRDTSTYRLLFTEDFRFSFDPSDSAGNPFREEGWTRDLELRSADHLLREGTATDPPASSLSLAFESVLHDEETGDHLDPTTHRKVSTSVLLQVQTGDSYYWIQGRADFYLVHYSAASLPAAIRSRVRDSDWFIYGWADHAESFTVGGLAPRPLRSVTWGKLKALYL